MNFINKRVMAQTEVPVENRSHILQRLLVMAKNLDLIPVIMRSHWRALNRRVTWYDLYLIT